MIGEFEFSGANRYGHAPCFKKLIGWTRNERRFGIGPELMQRARGEEFPGTVFSLDCGDAKMARGVAHLRKEPLHDRTAPVHLAEAPPRAIFRSIDGGGGGVFFEKWGGLQNGSPVFWRAYRQEWRGD